MKKRWMFTVCAAAALSMVSCGVEQGSNGKGAATTAQNVTTAPVTTEAPTQSIRSEAEKIAEEVEHCKAEKDAAEQKMNTCNAEYTEAQKVYDTAKAALDEYNTEHEDIVPYIGKGTLGFFEYVGADDAVDVLKNAKYASSTKIGEPGDATTLENMLATFPHMHTCNIVRDNEDKAALRVTDRLMAIAESNLNWTDEHLESSGQFDVDENYAAGYENPYYVWYDQEMESEGEHYKRVLNSSYALTGFAFCTAKRSGQYDFSHCQVFTGKTDEESFTVDEYEERFMAFYQAEQVAAEDVNRLTKEVETSKAKAEECKKKLDEAQKQYQEAKTAYQDAEAIYNWYT